MMELVRLYQAEVYRVSLRIAGRREDAEEATQDTFLQVFRKAATFEGRASVRTWIYSIALNAARMRRRAQVRHAEREVAAIDEYFHDDGRIRSEMMAPVLPDAAVLAREARDVLTAVIDALPELDRTIVTLADQEDLGVREIAEATGLSESAVKSRLHRARVALRSRLAEYFRPEKQKESKRP
jgi:RNA polymerase sigma-70 factor (ECF subfamily)